MSETHHEDASSDAEPRFGLVDIIEAFTAMRQELRTQSRETRDFSQSLVETSSGIAETEARLLAAAAKIEQAAAQSRGEDSSQRMAETIAEIDQHVLRAVQAISRTDTAASRPDGTTLQTQLTADFHSLGAIGRWFAKPLLSKIQATIQQWTSDASGRARDAANTQGLSMLVDRIERLMNDQQIERIETLGVNFNGETMNAIDAVEGSDHARGTVVEQLAPGYRLRGQLIKYAQVRIAK